MATTTAPFLHSFEAENQSSTAARYELFADVLFCFTGTIWTNPSAKRLASSPIKRDAKDSNASTVLSYPRITAWLASIRPLSTKNFSWLLRHSSSRFHRWLDCPLWWWSFAVDVFYFAMMIVNDNDDWKFEFRVALASIVRLLGLTRSTKTAHILPIHDVTRVQSHIPNYCAHLAVDSTVFFSFEPTNSVRTNTFGCCWDQW